MRLSTIVAPAAKVFEDISDSAIRWLNARVSAFGLSNVEVLKGAADDPKLPSGRWQVSGSWIHILTWRIIKRCSKRSCKRSSPDAASLLLTTGTIDRSRETEQITLHEIDPLLVRTEVETAGLKS